MQQRFKKSRQNTISAASRRSKNENEPEQTLMKPFYDTRKYHLPKKENFNVYQVRMPKDLRRFARPSINTNSNLDENVINKTSYNETTSSDYTDLDNLNFDTDLPFYIKFESDLLPLCYFDDDDYETVDFGKLKNDIKQKKTITGNSILLKSFKLLWQPVLILDMNEDHSTFLIEYLDNDIRKYVGRLNLQISNYDNDLFFQRRNEAIQRRDIFIRNQRFYSYLEYTLNPNQSILKEKNIKKILSLIPDDLKTNFQIIANLLREIRMIDVYCLYTDAYKRRLKDDESFIQKCEKLNFPTLNDFDPLFQSKQRNIEDSSSFHELAQKMISAMQISANSNLNEEEMKVKIRARILSELKLFEIDYDDHDAHNFSRDIKAQIDNCVNFKFMKKMRKMKEKIKSLSSFNRNMSHCIDKIIINSISEVTLNAIDDLYEAFVNKRVYFTYNYSYFNRVSFENELKSFHSIINSITECWKKAACQSTFSLFSAADEVLLPNANLLYLHLQRLKNYFSYDLKSQFDEIQSEINDLFQKFGRSFKIESFDPLFVKNLNEIDVDSYVSIVACSGSFIPPSRLLTNRQILKLQEISEKLTNDIIEIAPMNSILIRPNVKVLLQRTKKQLISRMQSMNNQIQIMLFLNVNSLIEQLQATLKMTYEKARKEPDNITIFLELRSFYNEVPLILDKIEKKRIEVSKSIHFLESIKSPLAHVLNQRFFDFRFRLHLFTESFPLRKTKLEEAKEDISATHATIESDVLSDLAKYETDLTFIVQQNVKDNISEMCLKTKETYENFKQLEPIVAELNLGKGVLLHNPFDQGRFERSLALSHDMQTLWEMVRDLTDLNADIASIQIQQLNVRSLFERCKKWNEEQARIRQSILYYPVAKNVSDKLANTIKEFTNYLFIIEVITSPILRQRHISMIKGLFASNPGNCVDSTSTFYQLINIKILDLKDKFSQIYEIAKSEYSKEKEIQNIINDLIMISVKLRIKNLKEFLINTQNLINKQERELNEIKKSKFAVPFLDRVELHLKLISELSKVFIVLNENVDIYYNLKLFITAEDTKKRNPSLFESFRKARVEFSNEIQAIKYVNVFPTKEKVFKSILDNFCQINELIPVYLTERKSEYIRFSILTNEEFFNLVSSTHSIEKFSPKIRYVLPYVSSFVIANGENNQLFVNGVKSFDSEVMYLNDSVQYTIDKIDILFENIIKSIRKTIRSQVLLLASRNFQNFLKQLSELPFQISFLYLNIKFTELFKDKTKIADFQHLQTSINDFQSLLKIIDEGVKSKNTQKSLNSLVSYFLSIMRKIMAMNGWIDGQDNENTGTKRKRRLLKRGSMFSIKVDSLITTKREKTPKFIKYVIENDKIFMKAKKFSIEYRFEYMGNDYEIASCPDAYAVESFLECISYNMSCCIPSDSLTANSFLSNVSVLTGRQLLSVHLQNRHFMSNYKDFLSCIEMNDNFILHFVDFNSIPSKIQCGITDFVESQKLNGILVTSDFEMSPFHFTFLRPFIVPEGNDLNINCVCGPNESVKTEKVHEYSILHRFQNICEITNLNDLKTDLNDKLLWFRCPLSLDMLSVFEQSPFILAPNGSRMFIQNCEFIFDCVLKSDAPKSILPRIRWLNKPPVHEEWKMLFEVVGSYDPIEFCLEHSSRLFDNDEKLTKTFIFSMIKEFYPSLTSEVDEVAKKLDVTFDSNLNIVKLIRKSIENKRSVIIVGNDKKIEMLQMIVQFFNEKEDIDLFFNLNDLQIRENDSKLFILLIDDSRSISFEYGRFCQFLPFSIDSKIESNCFETNFLNEAYQYLNDHFVLYSLFFGFDEIPSTESIHDYLIMQEDQTFSDFITDLLEKDIKKLTFIFIQCKSFQFSPILSFDWSQVSISKLANVRIVLITTLSMPDFEYFVGSICSFKLICRNNQGSILKNRLLNLRAQNSMTQKLKEKNIVLNDSYKILSEKQADFYYPLYLQSFQKNIEKRVVFLNEFLNSFSSSLEFEEKCNTDFNNATQFLHQCNVDMENAKSQLAIAEAALKHEIEDANQIKNQDLIPKLKLEETARDQIDSDIQSKIPSLRKAEKFMSNIDQTTVFMIRGIRSPTPSVLPIFECFAIIFNIKPEKKIVGKNRIYDYFPPVQKMMKDSKFFLTMLSCSKQNIENDKIIRLKTLLANSKSIMERSIKNNKDFSAIVKWFNNLVSSNEIRNMLVPLYQSLEFHKNEVLSIQNEIEKIDKKVENRKKQIDDIKKSITQLSTDIKNAEHQLIIMNSRKTNTIHFNEEMKEEVLHFQNEYEMLNEKLNHSNEICFARTLCVCYSSSLEYNDHSKSRKLYGRSFQIELKKEIQRKLHLNGLNDQVLKEKMVSVLDELTTPIIYDPDGYCFKLLRELFSNIQIIFGFQKVDPNLPTVAIIDDMKDSLLIKEYYSKSFIITKFSPDSGFFTSHFSKFFIFVNFSVPSSFEIFRENLFVSLHESNFESIAKYEDQIDEVIGKKISIIEKVNTSLKKNPLEFFEGSSWKNCLSFFADTKSSVEALMKDMNRIKEITFQSDQLARITARFSQILFDYMREIIGDSKFASILALMIDIVDTFHKPIEIFDKVKRVFQLCYQNNFENVSISEKNDDFSITFKKFDFSDENSIQKIENNRKFIQFENIEKNLQKKMNDYRNQFFRYSEEIQVKSDELIDLSINQNTKFSLKKIILSISSHFPIVIKSSLQDDPTNYLFKIAQCKTLILTKDYNSSLLRFNGWLIARYPDEQDDGFANLKLFLSNLLTMRQYPQNFRFIILVKDSTEIPFYLSQVSIIMSLPVLLPPSKIYEKLIKRVDDKMKNDSLKENIQIVANLIGSLSSFSRPTIVSDLLNQKSLDVMKIKSCPLLLPYKMYYIKSLNNIWLERILNMKKMKKSVSKSLFRSEIAYASISLQETDGSFPVDSISSLDCEIQNGIFIKVDRFYPMPLGRVWLTPFESNDSQMSKFNSILYGGNPVKQILQIQNLGDANCHFIFEL